MTESRIVVARVYVVSVDTYRRRTNLREASCDSEMALCVLKLCWRAWHAGQWLLQVFSLLAYCAWARQPRLCRCKLPRRVSVIGAFAVVTLAWTGCVLWCFHRNAADSASRTHKSSGILTHRRSAHFMPEGLDSLKRLIHEPTKALPSAWNSALSVVRPPLLLGKTSAIVIFHQSAASASQYAVLASALSLIFSTSGSTTSSADYCWCLSLSLHVGIMPFGRRNITNGSYARRSTSIINRQLFVESRAL